MTEAAIKIIGYPKGSGRTARMLLTAIDKAIQGKKVVVLVTETTAGIANRWMVGAGYPAFVAGVPTPFGTGSVELRIYKPQEFDLVSMTPRIDGLGVIDDPLVDHRVIEEAFPKMTEMLYQFLSPVRLPGHELPLSILDDETLRTIELLHLGQISEGWAARNLGVGRLDVRALLNAYRQEKEVSDETEE